MEENFVELCLLKINPVCSFINSIFMNTKFCTTSIHLSIKRIKLNPPQKFVVLQYAVTCVGHDVNELQEFKERDTA